MVDIVNTTQEVIQEVPILNDLFGTLIKLLGLTLLILLVYLGFLIYKSIRGWKDRKRWKRIEQKVNRIEYKLGELIEKKNKKKKNKKKNSKK